MPKGTLADAPLNRFGSSTSFRPTAEDAIQEAQRCLVEAIDLECSPEILQRLRLAANRLETVLARQPSDETLRPALAEVRRLSDHRRADGYSLRRPNEAALDTSRLGGSAAIRRVQEQVRQVAETDSTVLLLGETGSGKEVFASQIHELSRRRGAGHGPGELRRHSGDVDRKRVVRS